MAAVPYSTSGSLRANGYCLQVAVFDYDFCMILISRLLCEDTDQDNSGAPG